jgi:predicted O-methyltransferase YrrM
VSDFHDNLLPLVASVDGFLLAGEEEWLYNKALGCSDGTAIIEIGSLHGKSTSAMALACRNSKKHIYCFDLWWELDMGKFLTNLLRLDLLQHITPIRGNTKETLVWMTQFLRTQRIEFVFVDAGHEYDEVMGDYHGTLEFVKPGCRIAFHDVMDYLPGVKRCWNEVRGNLTDHEHCGSIWSGLVPKT